MRRYLHVIGGLPGPHPSYGAIPLVTPLWVLLATVRCGFGIGKEKIHTNSVKVDLDALITIAAIKTIHI